MLQCLEQSPRTGQEREGGVKIASARQLAPECRETVLLFERTRRHAEYFARTAFKVGEHAVAVEKKPHQKREGISSIAIGAASGRHP